MIYWWRTFSMAALVNIYTLVQHASAPLLSGLGHVLRFRRTIVRSHTRGQARYCRWTARLAWRCNRRELRSARVRGSLGDVAARCQSFGSARGRILTVTARSLWHLLGAGSYSARSLYARCAR